VCREESSRCADCGERFENCICLYISDTETISFTESEDEWFWDAVPESNYLNKIKSEE
jgi:hypothetical protein